MFIFLAAMGLKAVNRLKPSLFFFSHIFLSNLVSQTPFLIMQQDLSNSTLHYHGLSSGIFNLLSATYMLSMNLTIVPLIVSFKTLVLLHLDHPFV